MPNNNSIQWKVQVSSETDERLREFLQEEGYSEADFSSVIEKAVRKWIFHRTVDHIHERNRHIDPEVIQAEVDAALAEVRAEHRALALQNG